MIYLSYTTHSSHLAGTYSLLTICNRETERNLSFCVADVQSSKIAEWARNDDSSVPRFGTSCSTLRKAVAPARTPQGSKRRLIYFAHATEEAASICYATTEESDQCNLLRFFKRHSRYAKLSIDECSIPDNLWETEFHMSFYQLLEKSQKIWSGIPPFESKPFPGGQGKELARASTSFRFKGDIFDRFWTCHWLEYIHVGSKSIHRRPHILLHEKKDHQRKVLEQLFIADMLTSLTKSTEEILKAINVCLNIKSGSFSISNPGKDEYSFWRDLWQKFEPLLWTLEDDLANAHTTFKEWEEREKERGLGRPRWTQGDERKFGASIRAFRRKNKNHMKKLESLRANVHSLLESCSKHLDRVRDDLTFRSDQNIATFTYVTVIFLPLGFAASIFSMSGPPETTLVANMVTVSVAALAITILALVNGNVLAKMLDKLSNEFETSTTAAKETSVLVKNRKHHKEKDNEDEVNKALRYDSGTIAASWNLIFWMVYIFVEVPAWIITVGYRDLGLKKHTVKDLEALKSPEGPKLNVVGPLATGIHSSLLPTLAITGETVTKSVPEIQPGRVFTPGGVKRASRVVMGVLTIPLLPVTWIAQFLFFTVWDIFALLAGKHLTNRSWHYENNLLTQQPTQG